MLRSAADPKTRAAAQESHLELDNSDAQDAGPSRPGDLVYAPRIPSRASALACSRTSGAFQKFGLEVRVRVA